MENVKVVNLITLNAYTAVLSNVDNAVVARQMYEHATTAVPNESDAGWISKGFVQYDDLIVPVTKEITQLENEIKSVVRNISNKECVIDDIWGVVLKKDQSVIAHDHRSNFHPHPQEYFSFAYYPDAPEGSAELIFHVSYCDAMNHVISVPPQAGLLVVFNSYVSHMTARHKLEEPRLVISGNTSPVSPNLEPNADWSIYQNRPVLDDGDLQ